MTLAGSSLSGLELNSLTIRARRQPVRDISLKSRRSACTAFQAGAVGNVRRPCGGRERFLTPQGQEPVEELTLDSGVALDVLRPFNFPPPTFSQGAAAAATTATVTATLPIHLAPTITLAQASDAILVALNGFLASRRADTPLTVDALAAAIRDDSRFALVRADVVVPWKAERDSCNLPTD